MREPYETQRRRGKKGHIKKDAAAQLAASWIANFMLDYNSALLALAFTLHLSYTNNELDIPINMIWYGFPPLII